MQRDREREREESNLENSERIASAQERETEERQRGAYKSSSGGVVSLGFFMGRWIE